MIWWLLSKSDSSTSLMSLLLGMVIVLFLGRRSVNKRLVSAYVLLAIGALLVGEFTFGIFDRVVNLTGHNTTLAGRGELWRELLALHTNPILGVGFESFWLGERTNILAAQHWWSPTEAHNGYLETYLNLGLIGLFLLVGVIIATYRKACLDLLKNFQFGRFRLGLLVAIVVLNWTEATFKGLSPLWFVFYIIAMDYPMSETYGPDESGEYGYGLSGEGDTMLVPSESEPLRE